LTTETVFFVLLEIFDEKKQQPVKLPIALFYSFKSARHYYYLVFTISP
jgi:hypothetical protein